MMPGLRCRKTPAGSQRDDKAKTRAGSPRHAPSPPSASPNTCAIHDDEPHKDSKPHIPMSATAQSGFDRFLAADSRASSAAPPSADPCASSASAPDAHSHGLSLPYTPFPRQRDFHSSPAKYRLFGGAAGPGKSKALLMEAISRRTNASGRQYASPAPHVSRTRILAAALFPPRRSARALPTLSTTPSTSSPGTTARPRASAIPNPKTIFTSIRARNIFSSALTS